LGDPLAAVYRAIDDGVGELLAVAGDEAVVFVVSDVGMGPNFNGAHLLGDVLFRLGYGPPPAETSAAWRALRWVWRRLPTSWRARLDGLTKRAVDRTWPAFDPRWRCFAVNNGEVFGAIRVNLAGREPQGRVMPGVDYEDFCRRLGDDLLALVNADSGAPAVRRVLRTAEIYDGPRLGMLPDLLVEWNTGAALDAVRSPRLVTICKPYRGPRTGHHRREGFFLCRGPAIEPGTLAAPVDLIDVAPTIAALLGVELGEIDGRPIPACLPAAERPEARWAAGK
jgi:predicted AlkP superfamily phosphohydrolase/phosphomutase